MRLLLLNSQKRRKRLKLLWPQHCRGLVFIASEDRGCTHTFSPQIEVLEVEVSQKLEVYQNSAQVEQELVHVRFEHDESKREVGRLQNEVSQ